MKRRIFSFVLALFMLISLLPAVSFPAIAIGTSGAGEDALSALGIDSSKAPSGYDANSTANPYGRNNIQITQVPELYTVGLSSTALYAADYSTTNASLQNGNNSESHSTVATDTLKSGLYGNEAWSVKTVSGIMSSGAVTDATMGADTVTGTTTATGDYSLATQGNVDSSNPASAYSTKGFLSNATNSTSDFGSGFKFALSSVASGNFDKNTSSLSSQTVMVYTSDYSANGGLYLRFGDAKTGDYGSNTITLLGTSKKIGNPELTYTDSESNKSGKVENFANNPYQLQNYLQVATGDWNGDGIDEVAVYIPEQGASRISVYALQLTSADDTATAYKDASNWAPVWTYYLKEGSVVSNMVSLVSGDVNKDGIDDLAGTWGYYYGPTQNVGSTAVVMFGAKGTSLFTSSQKFDLTYGTSNIVRATFAYGDMAGTGTSSLILCGQSDADLQASDSKSSNTYTRYVALYNWDGSKFSATVCQNFDLFSQKDGSYIWPAMSRTTPVFYSLPLCSSNAAMISQGMSKKNQLLYFDGLIIEYTKNGLTIKEAWDNQSVTQTDKNNCQNYVEYGAVAGDFTGQSGYGSLVTMIQTLSYTSQQSSSYTISGSHQQPNYDWRYYYKNWFHKMFKIKTWYYAFLGYTTVPDSSTVTVNYGQLNMGKAYMVVADPTSGSNYYSRTPTSFSQSICLANTDNDASYMNYSGKHYFTYTDPEVLSVLSSPPYFSDLMNRDDLSGAYQQSATSYSKTDVSGSGKTVSTTISLGAYVSYEHEWSILGVTIAKMEAEATITAGFTYEMEKTSSLEQTITYSASAGEDMVAFYSIPMEIYQYTSYVPDGQGGYSPVLTTVNIPHEASVVLLPLDDYEAIAKDYSTLPKIANNVLTHTIGDPSTYPSSTNGYNVIAQYNDKPSSVGFTGADNGAAITQEIAMSTETSNAYIGSASVETKAGAGPGSLIIGVVAGVEAGGGSVTISTSGSSFSGSMQNMPKEAQPYGYGMNWKIFCYKYSDGSSSFPVVDYLVSQVGAPAPLPGDFAQDVSETTATSVTLTWSYDKLVSGFQLYRYYDFPVGNGSYEIKFVPFTAASRYDSITGTYYFSYTDSNLSPYSEYRYQIKTVQPTDPKYSIYSEPLSCRTKTEVGYPSTTTEGLNDSGMLPIYPDANSEATVKVANPKSYKSLSYQWQKLVDGMWTKLSGSEDATLSISNAGLADSTSYRCRINAIYYDEGAAQEYYISAYSDSFKTIYAKRSPTCGEKGFVAEEKIGTDPAGNTLDGLTSSIKLYSASGNHSTAPTGNVTFQIKGTDYDYSQTVALDVSGDTIKVGEESKYFSTASLTIDELPAGVYTVSAYYGGNRIFKDMTTSGGILVVIGDSTGYKLTMSKALGTTAITKFTYGDSIVPTLFEISKAADKTVQSSKVTEGISYALVNSSGVEEAFASGDTTPDVGSYTLRAYENGKLVATQGFTVEPKPIIVSIPDQLKVDAGNPVLTNQPVITCGEISAAELAALNLSYTALNSAGNKTELTDTTLPGKYTVTACTSSTTDPTIYKNYSVNYLSGTYIIVGATYELTAEAVNYTNADGSRSVGKVAIVGSADLKPKYMSGSDVTLYATPNADYQVEKWTATFNNGDEKTQEGGTIFSITTQAQAVDVKVTFKPLTLVLSTSVKPEKGGTISCNDENYSSGASSIPGAKYKFTATANPGYHFSNWRVDTAISSSTFSGTANDDGSNSLEVTLGNDSETVFAVFARDSYKLSLIGDISAYYMFDDDNDSVTPPVQKSLSSGAYVPGDTLITAVPKTGYQSTSGASFKVNGIPTGSAEKCEFIITQDSSVSLESVQNQYAVTVNSSNGTVTTLVNGQAADSDALSSVKGGSSLSFTPSADRGYVFDHWEVVNQDESSSNTSKIVPLTISAIGANTSITAVFAPNIEFTATAAVSNPARGSMQYTLYDIYGKMLGTADTVMPAGGITVYKGESITFTANVNSGNMVEQWKVNDAYNYTNKKTYTISAITGNIDATAYLKAASSYYVNFTQMGTTGSSLTATDDGLAITSGTLQFGGSTLRLSAAPAAGYMLDYWTVTTGDLTVPESADKIADTDGNTYFEPVYTIDPLTQNITVRAHFTELVSKQVTLPTDSVMGSSKITYVTAIQPTDTGTISTPTTSAEVRTNGTVKLAFTPNPGYRSSEERIKSAIESALGSKSAATVSVKQDAGTYYATVTKLAAPLSITSESSIYQKLYDITVPEHVTASPSIAAAGDSVTLTVTPTPGYTLSTLSLDNGTLNEKVSPSTLTYSFTMPEKDVNVSATFNASVPGGGGGNPPTDEPKVSKTTTGTGSDAVTTALAELKGKSSGGTSTGTVDEKTMETLISYAKSAETAGGKAVIKIAIPAVLVDSGAALTIPAASFHSMAADTSATLEISTGIATLSLNSAAVDSISSSASGDVVISMSQVNTSALSEQLQKTVGDRPVYNFSVSSNGQSISDFGSGSATVSMPYTLRSNEDPNAVVVYYIDASGNLKTMQGQYDTATKTVSFVTSHFSYYMIGYKKLSFRDVASSDWYYVPVTFIAARDITTGTSEGIFSPDMKLTRGQFIVFLMRSYGISAANDSSDNFADAGNSYYTGYLAAAKKLGITAGVGNNMFAPEKEISRQEMFTLLYNTLKSISRLPQGNSGKKISDFSDEAEIATWAKEAISLLVKTGSISGSDGKLTPTAATTRAEMAQLMYNLLSK